jgi:hypothetical protein
VQLGAIPRADSAPEQYAVNIATKRGSHNPVNTPWCCRGRRWQGILPIDAKFPADAYTQLTEAYDAGAAAAVAAASALLTARIKAFARVIRDKYIDHPTRPIRDHVPAVSRAFTRRSCGSGCLSAPAGLQGEHRGAHHDGGAALQFADGL